MGGSFLRSWSLFNRQCLICLQINVTANTQTFWEKNIIWLEKNQYIQYIFRNEHNHVYIEMKLFILMSKVCICDILKFRNKLAANMASFALAWIWFCNPMFMTFWIQQHGHIHQIGPTLGDGTCSTICHSLAQVLICIFRHFPHRNCHLYSQM